MGKKSKTYVNLVGSSIGPGRKRKIAAKKGRKANAATTKRSRGKSRNPR